MTDKPWKVHERKTADRLEGERLYFGGRKGDVGHDRFFIECKYRQKLSIYPMYEKAKSQCPKDKIPLLVVKQKRKHGELIVLSMNDFVKLLEGWNEKQTD